MSDFVLEQQEPGETETFSRGSWGVQLAIYLDTLTATLTRAGIAPERAAELAEHCTLDLARAQGGARVYLPTGHRLYVAARNRRIFLEWRGNNAAELMTKYRLRTERRLQQIIAAETAILRRRTQPDFSAIVPGFPKPE